jgi:ABC-type branched-subunit amino acid transport system ATPase component
MSEAPHAGGEVILRAEDVAVHFGGVKAVDGMSFELTAGRIFGILGPNGSGKTTLLAALTRLVPLTHGSLTLDGEAFDRVSAAGVARRRVARTLSSTGLIPKTRSKVARFVTDLRMDYGGEEGEVTASEDLLQYI